MPDPVKPAAAKLSGRKNWVFVPTIAGYSATPQVAPTVSELTGASALDLTKTFFADGAPVPTPNTNLVDQNARFGDTVTYQFVGKTSLGGGQIKYSFDPQSATGATGRKAYEALKGATDSQTVTGFLVWRGNVPNSTDFAIGQKVTAYPVEIGPSYEASDGDGEAEEAGMAASFAITGPPLKNIAITA